MEKANPWFGFIGGIIAPGKHNFWIWFQTIFMLGGLFFGHWNPLLVVMAYFFETIIIGITHIVKMIVVWKYGKAHQMSVKMDPYDTMNHFGSIPFFIMHYFFFVGIQSVFVFLFFGKGVNGIVEPFHIFENYGALLSNREFLLVFSLLAITQISRLTSDWFFGGKFHQYTIKELMFQPYLRIFIQQFVAILGVFTFILFQKGEEAAILVIGLRFLTDLTMALARKNEVVKGKLIKGMLKNNDLTEPEARKQLDIFLET